MLCSLMDPVAHFSSLQIQIFLLKMNNKKRILVRLERLTIFVVEQENSLENAVSYYLGGVPPAVLPPRWVQPTRGCGQSTSSSPVFEGGPGPSSTTSRAAQIRGRGFLLPSPWA